MQFGIITPGREIWMEKSVFVGRAAELGRLKKYLDAAREKVQVVFIAGEAGAGKSTLIGEFVRQGEEEDPTLIAAVGECNAQTGAGDPYLPFRQVLTTLTTDSEDVSAAGSEAGEKNSNRLKNFIRESSSLLIDTGPDLIGIFVPGAAAVGRIVRTLALKGNVSNKLAERVSTQRGQDMSQTNAPLDQEKIFEQYTAVLKALSKERVIILILDDLQWADSGSLNMLFHLARELKDSHILIVGTFRPDDVALGRDGERHPLESILNELKRYLGNDLIDLSKSSSSEAQAFVNELVNSEPNHLGAAFIQELYAHTGGHPLFTVELLRNMQERGDIVKDSQGYWTPGPSMNWEILPARIEGVIAERIARLPEGLHETLTIGSVMGYEFTAQVIERVQKLTERELIKDLSRELEKRYRLVVEEGETKVGQQTISAFRFNHILFQQFLYTGLGAGERRLLHGEVAGALEMLYLDHTDEIAMQLARHYQEAGEDEKAITYLIRAGDGAFRVYAQQEAVKHYTRALELGKQKLLDIQQLKYLYTRRGRALELCAQFEQALQNYDEMRAISFERRDRGLELASQVASSTIYSTTTRVMNAQKGQAQSEEALLLARELGDRAAEARILWNLMLVNLLTSNALKAIAFGEESLTIARELELREQMAYTLGDIGWAYNLAGQFEEADTRLEEAGKLWQELGNLPMFTNNLSLSMFGFYWSGRYEKALRVAEESYQLGASIKNVWNQALPRHLQGEIWLDQGEMDKALPALQESIQIAESANTHVYVIWFGAVLCWAYASLGAVQTGLDLYHKHRVPNQDVPVSPARDMTLIAFALFEIASGKVAVAEETLENCSANSPIWESMLQYARSKLALAHKDYAQALAIADAGIETSRRFKIGVYLADTLFVKANAHLMQGEPEQARYAFEHARIQAELLGSRSLLWQILAALADLEIDRVKADALREGARETVEYIADHIPTEELRNLFMNTPAVNALMPLLK
jgi:predicted ATPase